MNFKLDIKPLTVNQAWKGRRYKTEMYERYETDLLNILPKFNIEDKRDIRIDIEFGISKLMDIDNGLKPLIDILQKKYKFNDRYIMELNIKKTVVKKKEHFIKINIEYI